MRFFLASFVAAVAVADESCDTKEPVSMLQTKDRSSLSKEKEPDLIKVVSKASHYFEGDAQVGTFLEGVKNALKNMKEADGKEALLQRASQSEQMQELIGQFRALPGDERQKLTSAGGGILDKLPVSQRSALVQQVSHALDESVSSKTETKTEQTAQGKSTVTHNAHTGYYHRHTHGQYGTESVSKGKNGGHEHRHSYSHNGQGGNARTNTESKSIQGHIHAHRHAHTLQANGRTDTNTNTYSRDQSGNVHTHGHHHDHRGDVGTHTRTVSGSNGRTHEHGHHHNERNGNSQTDSTNRNYGVKTWHHGHDHDAVTGVHHSHGTHSTNKWNWNWLLDDDYDSNWDDDYYYKKYGYHRDHHHDDDDNDDHDQR